MTKMTMATLIERLATASPADPKTARRVWAEYRGERGRKANAVDIFTAPDGNTKLAKGTVPNYGLTLAPANLSRRVNLCVNSTRGCRKVCLNTAGKGVFDNVQYGRYLRTIFMLDEPEAFLGMIQANLDRYHVRHGDEAIGVRLNVLSDIPWELAAPWVFERYPTTAFYDYTKDKARMYRDRPTNYHLTFSASERDSDEDLVRLIEDGHNVAIVARKLNGFTPETFYGHPVIDGDKHDFRPSDGQGVAVTLTPKGEARTIDSGGFVRTAAGFDIPSRKAARAA